MSKLSFNAVIVFDHDGDLFPTLNDIEVGTRQNKPEVEFVIPASMDGNFVVNVKLQTIKMRNWERSGTP